MFAMLIQETHAALGLIRRRPAFSAFAIAVLAIGIAAATMVFTLVQAVLIRDLPFSDPDRLVWMYNLRTERDRAPLSIADLEDYRRGATSVEAFAPFTNVTANLTGAGDAERLEGVRVAGNFFQVVGTRPGLGRTLQPADDTASARVVVLTHGLWTRRFGGDPTIVGRPIVLNGASYIVVGVMPAGFLFPFRDAEIAFPLPLQGDARRADRGANFLRVVARLKPGVTTAQARTELNTIARRLQTEFPEDDARKTGVSLYPLQAEIVADYQRILWLSFAAVGVLLAVACGNLANLLMIRSLGRRTELAVRVSLGSSRTRLAWQLLSEAGALSVCGGAIGVALAWAGIAAWRTFGPADFPRMTEVAIDGRVLLFAGLVVCGATVLAGFVPAWLASRSLNASLRDETRAHTGSRGQGLVRRGFVMLQVAASVVLIICTTLVARGFARLEQVDPGFQPENAVTIQLSLPPTRYSTGAAIITFYEALRGRLAADPVARYVGAVSLLPLSGMLNTIDVGFPDRPAPHPDEVPQAHFRIASDGYFEAAGLRLMAGRTFAPSDDVTNRRVAIVSQTFAGRHWPQASAIGKAVQLQFGPTSQLVEVVGVVNDVKQFTLDREATADLYVPLLQMPESQAGQLRARMYWVARTREASRQLESTMRTAVHAVDPDVAASSVRTLDAILQSSLGSRRMNVRLLEFFGAVAIALAAMGVYAIASFSIRSRNRELAVRSAFGARASTLVTSILTEELRPVMLGLFIGLIGAVAAARSFGDLVFAIAPTDPSTYLGVAITLLAVATLAVYMPIRRVASIDPATLLRG